MNAVSEEQCYKQRTDDVGKQFEEEENGKVLVMAAAAFSLQGHHFPSGTERKGSRASKLIAFTTVLFLKVGSCHDEEFGNVSHPSPSSSHSCSKSQSAASVRPIILIKLTVVKVRRGAFSRCAVVVLVIFFLPLFKGGMGWKEKRCGNVLV